MAKICVPIVENSAEKILQKIEIAAKKKVDAAEIWLDQIPNFFAPEIFFKKKLPILAVLKKKNERGNFAGSDKIKFEILQKCADAGADFCDFDAEMPDIFFQKFRKKNTKLISSAHFWDRTPSLNFLKNFAQQQISRGADIVKIAAMPQNSRDVEKIFEFENFLTAQKIPHITISMGALGEKTRFLPNNFFTFAPLEKKKSTADGQISLEKMREILQN